ncbi:hypothetical protein, partial [Mycobacterium marinum]|uniref:hypothetical protein n=1 Tax=Mycobacterium marinum TaxID=1781 RepID=UPI001C3D6275
PLCTWGGFSLWGFFSSPKPSDTPTSSATSVFSEDKSHDPDENAFLELEGVDDPNEIDNEDKATTPDENPRPSPQVRLQRLETALEFN